MHEFRFSLRTPEIFKRVSLWFSIYNMPTLNDEFMARMTEMFGDGINYYPGGLYCHARWHTSLDGRKVRAKGSGNIGGWEWKPYVMIFHFPDIADAIMFKMEWGHLVSTK